MRLCLLHISFIITLFIHSIISYGQTSIGVGSTDIPSEPLYLLNSTIIVNCLFVRLNPKDFKKIVVYKGLAGPGQFSDISSSGIVDITYNEPINSQSLSEIATQRQLSGPIVFILNGHKLNATQSIYLRIVPEAIDQLRVTYPASKTSETIVNIQTVVSKRTTQSNARNSNEHRIMIR